MSLIRGADLVATPWKNGGGVTREIAAFPQHAGLDSFVWRVSIADVTQAGPFSRFADVERTLVLLSGAGMLLDETLASAPASAPTLAPTPPTAHAQRAHPLKTHALMQPLDMACFAGEAPIDARLVNGATRDFNLMVRRGVATGEVQVWRGMARHALSADVVLLHCASGPVKLTFGERHAPAQSLQTGDTLRINVANALPCLMEGDGALLAISIRYTPR
ncbi:HutD family protein [Paraburkholderia sp. PREW-6R]|uniref:HutD/Ves family protein n=1 Tax=Paraburkholderia sp. PREW-6R TaxID=3141544 RepID=UPI0031F4FC60